MRNQNALLGVLAIAGAAFTPLLAAQPTARLVPSGPRSFYLEIDSASGFLGGEIGLRYDGSTLVFREVREGPDFPEGDGEIRVNPAPGGACPPQPGVDSSITVGWVQPIEQGVAPRLGLVSLPAGRHRVLEIIFDAGDGAIAGECAPIVFADCLGVPGARVHNIITDLDFTSRPLETEDATSCESDCRVLEFAEEQVASCQTLSLRLADASGDELAARTFDVAGWSGFDLAGAVLRWLVTEPVEELRIGRTASGVQLCLDAGGPVRVFLQEARPGDDAPVELGEVEVLPGERIGPCGLDTVIGLPGCPDGDADGVCDDEDLCPGEPNIDGAACPGDTRYCRRIKFDPLCAFKCPWIAFEVRLPDGVTPFHGNMADSRRVVTIEGRSIGRDIAVEVCRTFGGESAPPGFSTRRTSSGCVICNDAGEEFRIFLIHPSDGGAEDELEVTIGRVTAACGLRIWDETEPCAEGEDVDGDGVCDGIDNCPSVYNPSQASLDGDCVGDACQARGRPADRVVTCFQDEAKTVALDGEVTWDFRLEGCGNKACFSFDATSRAPVVVSLERPEGGLCTTLRLIDPSGRELTGRITCGGELQHMTAGPLEGLHAVRVLGENLGDASADMTLVVRSVNLGIESLTPDRGPQGGRASVSVRGVGFDESTQFFLRPSGDEEAAEIPLGQLVVLSPELAEGRFSLADASLGQHDLIAREGPVDVLLPEAFEVVDAGSFFGLEVDLVGPTTFRGGVVSRTTLVVTNTGDAEIPAPLFRVTAPFRTRLRSARSSQFLCSNTVDPGPNSGLRCGEILVLATNPEGFAGVLSPGATARIPIVLVNDHPVIQFPGEIRADLLTPLPTDFVDWDAGGIWSEASDDLSGILGATWGEVVEQLGETATRLRRRGEDASSVRHLMRFALQRAFECPVEAIVGRVLGEVGRSVRPDQVVVARSPATGGVLSVGRTDARGTFSLRGLAGGRSYDIEVPGTDVSRRVDVPGGADVLALELVTPTRSLEPAPPVPPSCDAVTEYREPLFPPPELFTPVASVDVRFRRSWDPNDKSGPDGEGDEGFLGAVKNQVYTIHFENIAPKTGPGLAANTVEIVDRLPPGFDWNSIRLLDVWVAGRLYPLDVAGEDRENGYLLYRSTSNPFEVSASGLDVATLVSGDCQERDFQLDATVNTSTGVIRWVFRTIDCDGEVISPVEEEGFLPPNVTSPEGQGYVSFSVDVRGDLADNTDLSNSATIRFDSNPSIVTNTVRNAFSLFLPAKPPSNPRLITRSGRGGDGSRPVPLDVSLGWQPGGRTRGMDLFFWKEGEARPGEPSMSDVDASGVEPPIPLEYDASYHWQIVARNIRDVETVGEVWSFTTIEEPPPCPGAPMNLRREGDDLVWTPGANTTPSTYYAVFLWNGDCEAPPARPIRSLILEPRLEWLPEPDACATMFWQVVAMNESCPTTALGARSQVASFPSDVGCEVPTFRRGDVDGNGTVEITDPINNLTYQFLGAYDPPCLDALDFDDSGTIEITDPINNLTHQFLGGDPPAAPGRDTCGCDPTPDDDLGCENPPASC